MKIGKKTKRPTCTCTHVRAPKHVTLTHAHPSFNLALHRTVLFCSGKVHLSEFLDRATSLL